MSKSIENQPRSVSQVDQYLDKCGHQYKLQRIDKVTPRPAAWSFQGTAFHSAAEELEKSGRAKSEEEMVQLFSDQYSAMVNGAMHKEPDLSRWMTANKKPAGQDIEERYRLGQSQVRDYVRWSVENKPVISYVKKDGDPTPGLELYFKVELGGVVVRGYIDQLVQEDDGSVRVRDLKTGSTKSHFQLETYAVAVRKQFGEVVNRGDWYFGKTGKLSKTVDLSEVTEDQVAARFVEMDQGVKAGRFEARPGFHCGFCDVSHACSYFRAR
ncbi:Cas4 exonuclease [Streptomyces phage Ibantik]|uniref:Cas4 exonuclease n=1 Tax=Streptomyces phage Ibantik TaxID=2182397 RepID=A0A2U8UNH0_9CAUD|nr:RecB-like exonuclease [Streptomyces phage Ibantik]AWN05277.1 Cas4 exonuclease [Streptomyces phage Ibantik]